jgi:hypothetical protein
MLFGHETHVEAIKSIVVYETHFFWSWQNFQADVNLWRFYAFNMMSLTLASNEFFSTNFSTFLTQKIVENLEVFVVLNVHLTNFFSLGGCLANFLYHKIKKKSPVQHIIF